MPYQFPLTITEIPHQGKPETWTIYDADHLSKCIEFAERSGYSDWQFQEGLLTCIEKEDGEIEVTDHGAYTLDAYIDWLRHDLSQLIVHELVE